MSARTANARLRRVSVDGADVEHRPRTEETMADNPARPSEAQVQAFVEKMRTYRDTLPEDEQRLLNSMFLAAVGNRAEQEGDVHAYWYAYPTTNWSASPWSYSYSYYYPRYW